MSTFRPPITPRFVQQCAQTEDFLSGWSTSTDEVLIQECLKKALTSIQGGYFDEDARSHVSNVVCKTQSVNGLHIRLSFSVGQERWQYSFYKSFTESSDLELEQCQRVGNEELVSNDERGCDNDDQDILTIYFEPVKSITDRWHTWEQIEEF